MWGLTPRFANAKADLPPSGPREFFPPIKRGPGLGVAPANLDLSVRSAEASGDVRVNAEGLRTVGPACYYEPPYLASAGADTGRSVASRYLVDHRVR
jgi:hypothetical protein